jgi:hypothetical protein
MKNKIKLAAVLFALVILGSSCHSYYWGHNSQDSRAKFNVDNRSIRK